MSKHFALLAVMTLSACLGEIESGPIIAIDEAAILANVAMYRDTTRFDPINGAAYPSALGGASMIELYALQETAVLYTDIDPVGTGSGVVIPEGGIIVREVLEGDEDRYSCSKDCRPRGDHND